MCHNVNVATNWHDHESKCGPIMTADRFDNFGKTNTKASSPLRVLQGLFWAASIIIISTIIAFAVPLPEPRPDPNAPSINAQDIEVPEVRTTEPVKADENATEANTNAAPPSEQLEEPEAANSETETATPTLATDEPTAPAGTETDAEVSSPDAQNASSESQDTPEANLAALPALRPDRPGETPPAATPVPEVRPSDPPPPSRVVSADDYFLLRQIIALLKEDSIVAAQALTQKLNSPLAKTVAEWLYVRDRSLHAGAKRVLAFIDANPDWPSQSLLHKRIEALLFISPQPAKLVTDYFSDREPRTGLGLAVLAQALLRTGEKERSADLIRAAWRGYLLSRSTERLILSRFGGVLREEDHLDRLRYLLYRKKIAAARRAAGHVGPYGNSLVNAHNAISARSRRARQAYVRAPAAIKQDPAVLLRQAQSLRRAKKYVEAAALLVANTPNDQDAVNGNGWWSERRYLVRRMLTAMRPDLAHKLAANHHTTNRKFYAEAEFLAGWVALRYLYDADLAYFHFRKLRKSVTQPLSIARAEYWLGRAEDMRADHSSAIIRYANAEKYPFTFYGQLAMAALGRKTLDIPPIAPTTIEERETFDARDLTQAAILFHELGERRHSRRFLVQNASLSETETGAILSAELAESHGQPDTAHWIGKAAFLRDHLVYQAAHTLTGLPEGYDQVSGLEPALIYAVSRQESAFDIAAVSHAGARGLMQLMPPTAREVAGLLKIEYSLARLTQDPSYNVTLGSTYLDGLITRFKGSYIMAIPGYNAGGGRVNRWTRVFGDPRNPLVDPIDWIERMPLSEPRNYVQRVLANLQIYRAILAGGSHELNLLDDLQRGVGNAP